MINSSLIKFIKTCVIIIIFISAYKYIFPETYTSELKTINSEFEGEIPVYQANNNQEFSVDSINRIRADFFEKHPNIISGSYKGNGYLLQNADPQASWHSALDEYFYKITENQSHPGPPSEELGLINPLILVYPKFNAWTGRLVREWDLNKIISYGLKPENIELIPVPDSFYWSSSQKLSKLNYNLTDYKYKVDPFLIKPLDINKLRFCTVDFNAADIGYDYISVKKSYGNILPVQERDIEQIYPFQFAHLPAEACNSIAAGCNRRLNMSDSDRCFTIEALPASIEYLLWDDKPKIEDQAADFQVQITFN